MCDGVPARITRTHANTHRLLLTIDTPYGDGSEGMGQKSEQKPAKKLILYEFRRFLMIFLRILMKFGENMRILGEFG